MRISDWSSDVCSSDLLFHTNFKNKVVSFDSGQVDPINPARPLYVYDNIDRVVIKGVEVNGTLPILPELLLSANYPFPDSERRGGGEPAFDGSPLDGRSEERRVGKDGVRPFRYWWSPYPYK